MKEPWERRTFFQGTVCGRELVPTSVLLARVFTHAVLSVGPERSCDGG